MEQQFTQAHFYAARAYLASKTPTCSLSQTSMAKQHLHVAPNLYAKWERNTTIAPAVAVNTVKILTLIAEHNIKTEEVSLEPFFAFCHEKGIEIDEKTFCQDHFASVRAFLAFNSPGAKLNQEEMAGLLGVVPNLYSKWERGGETGNSSPAVAMSAVTLLIKLSILSIDYQQLTMREFWAFADQLPEGKVKMF